MAAHDLGAWKPNPAQVPRSISVRPKNWHKGYSNLALNSGSSETTDRLRPFSEWPKSNYHHPTTQGAGLPEHALMNSWTLIGAPTYFGGVRIWFNPQIDTEPDPPRTGQSFIATQPVIVLERYSNRSASSSAPPVRIAGLKCPSRSRMWYSGPLEQHALRISVHPAACVRQHLRN